jgi:D-alanyl-D-alanine carboxypeptidase
MKQSTALGSLSLSLAVVLAGQSMIPETPVGGVLRAWVSAVNSGERAQLESFQKSFAPDRPDMPDRFSGLFRQTGGIDVTAISESTPTRLIGTFKNRNGTGFLDFTFAVANDPPRLAGMRVGLGIAPSPPGTAPTEVKALGPEDLNKALDEEAAKTGFSGTVLVARQGKPVFEKAYGFADRERKIPNTLATRLRIGSMNKMFTAVATLQLIDIGKIDLNAPLIRYLPDYPNKELAQKVTIRHLLTHTGGTGDIFTPEYQAKRMELREHRDYVRLLGARAVEFEPGTRWEYSNYGFVLLGNVIEAVTGASYYDYVRRNVFEPAGMKDTDSLPESELTDGYAVGYMQQSTSASGLYPNTATLPYRGISAGGGYSTVQDLLKFANALQAGKLLSQKWLEEATKPEFAPGPGYGYGFGVFGAGKKASFGHNGGAPGMNGELRVYPESGVVIAAIANLDPPVASHLIEFFDRRLPE